MGDFPTRLRFHPGSRLSRQLQRLLESPAYGIKDYPAALAAIMSVMVRDLKLPAVDGSVTLYFSQVSYEAGVVAESERDLERLRKQLGPGQTS